MRYFHSNLMIEFKNGGYFVLHPHFDNVRYNTLRAAKIAIGKAYLQHGINT